MNKISLDILKKNIEVLNLSAQLVQRSYDQTHKIVLKNEYTDDEFDKLENLASRYARTTDMLVNKVLRSIDTYEYEEIRTIIDVMNRAEKRRIVSSTENLQALKDLRNNIVHEYQIKEISRFFEDKIKYTPVLLDII